MRKCFVGSDAVRDGRVYIESPEDVRHIRSVLRMKEGDSLTACDDAGREYTGVIERAGDAVVMKVTDIVRAPEPRVRIALYQCVPKQGKMETVIRKATELGAVRFVPVFSERSVPKPSNMDAKLERWQRVAEEAAKQSGRGSVPAVDVPLGLSEAVGTFGEFDLVVFPYEMEDRRTIKDVLRAAADAVHIAIVIGPEGGFTDAEAFAIEDVGGAPCSLGATILRSETAGPAAVAMTLYELEL
jgi:16S rRNA (uracil1498-N3)-methyltransferase